MVGTTFVCLSTNNLTYGNNNPDGVIGLMGDARQKTDAVIDVKS